MADWYLSTDNAVWVRGLTDAVTGGYVNDATITGNLYNENDEIVANGADISLSYVADSDGDYLGHIPDNAAMTEGERYRFRCVVVSGSYQWTFEVDRQAAYDKVGV